MSTAGRNTHTMVISLDAMGGEGAPKKVLEGAALSLKGYPHLHFLACGNPDLIGPILDDHPDLKSVTTIVPTTDVVADTEKPAHALRHGRSSSMRLAIDAVHDHRAHAVVSSGNTGAYMAMSKFVLKTYKGIDRPAIATLIPSVNSEFVLLDMGANTVCTSDYLVQFAVLGAAYVKSILGLTNPRVAILNIGAEEQKGLPTLQQAALRLKNHPDFNFIGFIEADDMMMGGADVVVTDGFTGNVVLKTIEGTVRMGKIFLSKALSSSWLSKLGYLLARPALNYLAQRVNPSNYNGAIFLGLQGIAIKSHGKADAFGYASAISVAVDMLRYDFEGTIATMLDHMPESEIEAPTANDDLATANAN